MSSALNSPQKSSLSDTIPKTKFRIRWRFLLLGLVLCSFGLALPFALNFYYSSPLSQKSGFDSKKIQLQPTPKSSPPKSSFQKKESNDNFIKSFQARSDEKQTSQPVSLNQIVSTEPADVSKISTTTRQNQTSKKATTVVKNPKINRAKILENFPQTEQTKPPILEQQTVTLAECPAGEIPVEPESCGKTQVTFSDARLYKGAQCGEILQKANPLIWDLRNCQPGTYSVYFIRDDKRFEGRVTVNQCRCTPKPTPSPIPSVTFTQSPITSPTIPDTPVNVNVNTNINTDTNFRTPTSSPINTVNVNAGNTDLPKDTTDKFSYTYPSRFIKGTEHTVCLSLQPEGPQASLCDQTDTNANTINRGNEGLNLPIKEGSDLYVTARLIPTNPAGGIKITPQFENAAKLYYEDKKREKTPRLWQWKVELPESAENLDAVELKFRCDFEWRPRNAKSSEKTVKAETQEDCEKSNKCWESNTLTSGVGLPATAKIISLFSTAGGGLAFVFSFIPIFGWKGKQIVLEDEVHCTLYAPPTARAGTSFVIQVFAHLLEQAAGLEAIVRELDAEAKKHAAEKLKRKIKRGSMLTFKLTMPGLEPAETEESATWEGEPLEVQFIVSVPDDHKSGNRFGKVSVYENNEKIGTIYFRIEIIAAAQPQAFQPSVSALAQMTRRDSAFVSYASEDKAEVYDFLRLLDTVGVSYHVDIINIAPGDRWEQKLYEFIDSDDLFLLFWSKAASRSEWVLKEAERANTKTGKERKNPPKIVIFQLETPPEAELPDWLRDIHYDRKWTQIIQNAHPQN